MQRTDQSSAKDCWVDVFESTFFMGRMKRVFGPVRLKQVTAASIIVGPKAHLELQVKKNGKPVNLSFEPKKLVPDVAASLSGAQLLSASVSCSRRTNLQANTDNDQIPRPGKHQSNNGH
jgi:hypothetical protein